MSTFTKARTRRQQRHTDSLSKSHMEDKRAAESRRNVEWIAIPAPQYPGKKRDFQQLGLTGHAYKHCNGKWIRCEKPEEYADYIQIQSKKRDTYLDHTTRKGIPVTMKRRVKAPIEILVVPFAPYLTEYVHDELMAGRDPRPYLVQIRNLWLKGALKLFLAKRDIVGYSLHADTNWLHFDLALCRQDLGGHRIGKSGLMLAGPWNVGVDRQIRCGAKIASDKKVLFGGNVRRFRARYGAEAKPTDVILARMLDSAADEVLGPRIQRHKLAYANSVPQLEAMHRAAQLDRINSAKSILERNIPQVNAVSEQPSMTL